MEYQKTSSRIYCVNEEETKRKSKGKRWCKGQSLLKIQPLIGVKMTHCNIMSLCRFLCDECIGLQLQTKEYNWTRR